MAALRLLGLLACLSLLPTCKGGLASHSDIVGGRKATRSETRSLAFLLDQQRRYSCGGFLVHPRFVLTAASCLDGRIPGRTLVVLGAYDRYKQERSRQTFSVISVSENGYDPNLILNDLLLLEKTVLRADSWLYTRGSCLVGLKRALCGTRNQTQLDREAILGRYVAPLALPEQNVTVQEGTSCLVAGWGRKGSNHRLPRFPQALNVTVTPDSQCRPGNVCTGVLTHEGGICQGDGGTPLICNGLAHGVASQGFGRCGSGVDFFTRVSLFRNWIDSVLNQGGLPPQPRGASGVSGFH